MRFTYLNSLLLSAAVVSSPAFAQEIPADSVSAEDRAADMVITVVASGSRERVDQTGQSVSVIGTEEIERIGGPDITRVLERAPGVTITRNGGLGGFTGVRVRGAESEQLLVLVDGVRVADVAAPGGGFDFGNLLSGSVGKIELLRGSNSVVWGSRAMGGVLAVTSKEVDGVEASAEYGAYDSIYATAAAGIVTDRFSGGLTAGYQDTDGFSTAAVGTEPDGFRQWQVTGRAKYDVMDGLALVANGRWADGKLDIDGFPPPTYMTFGDTAEYQKTEEWSGRFGAEYTSTNLDLMAGYSIANVKRWLFDPAISPDSYFTTDGRDERVELRGRYRFGGGIALDFGADNEWSRFDTADAFSNVSGKAEIASGHALLGWYTDNVTLAAGVRIDDHSDFGSEWTFGANGSVGLGGGWRVRASYGEGFKAPTLYQLMSDYGNGQLKPETSKSYDIGIEKGDRNAGLHVALTAFRRDSRNLIDFISCFGVTTGICTDRPFGTYDNVGKARAEGFEAELGAKMTERFSAQVVYTYVEATNRTDGSPNEGNDLARRPRHALTMSADWTTPLADLAVGGDIRLVSDSYDNASNTTSLDGYALLTLRASLPVTEKIELFGRVENVGDADYQTAAGFGTPGRSAYIGAKARF
jgi:vitamin B12 transporter